MMSEQDYDEAIKHHLCMCGSKLRKHALYDGYGIFLTYACDECEKKKLSEFRSDIMERYDCDEPIESD